jgi:hypothetical protein
MKSSQSRQLSVAFDESVRVKYIPTIDDIPEAEILATWYSKSEYRGIQKREARLVRVYSKMNKMLAPGDKTVLNGLDTNEIKRLRRKRVNQVRLAVFQEQERNKNFNTVGALHLKHGCNDQSDKFVHLPEVCSSYYLSCNYGPGLDSPLSSRRHAQVIENKLDADGMSPLSVWQNCSPAVSSHVQTRTNAVLTTSTAKLNFQQLSFSDPLISTSQVRDLPPTRPRRT